MSARNVELDKLRRRLAEAEHAVRSLAHGDVFQAIFNATLDALLLADDRGVYVDANPAACELFGLPRERLIGRQLSEFTPPGYDQDAAWREFLHAGRQRGRFPLRRPDGTFRELDFSATAHVLPGLHLSALRDVTEQYRAEDALKTNEARFRAVVEKSLGAVTLSRADGVRLYASEAVAALLGYTPAEFLKLTRHQQVVPEDRPRIERELAELFAHPGHSIHTDWRAFHRDGSHVWLEATLTNLFEEPAVGALVACFHDVTDRKRAEEALRESRALLEQAEALAHVGSWKGGVEPDDPLLLSDECYRLIGHPVGRPLKAADYYAMVHRDDLEIVKAAIRRVDELGGEYDAAYRIVRPDGELRWVHARGTLQRSGPDARITMTGVLRDITARRRAEETRNRLVAIVETSEDAITSADNQGIITSWNRGAEKLYGYTADQAVGRPIHLIIPPDDPLVGRQLSERVARGESIEAFETVRVRKDGVPVPVSLALSPLRDAAGRVIGASGIARDLREAKRAQAALQRSQEQLRQAARMDAVGSLAGGLAHDFNNLLQVVVGYTSLVLGGLPPGSPLRAEVEQVQNAADRAVALTGQLLAFSRRQVLKPVVLDLNQVVLDFERMFRRLLGEDIALVVSTSPALDPVSADPSQLEQVILNLALNARDAMPHGGTLTIETHNRCLDDAYCAQRVDVKPGPYVELQIGDTGQGIPEDLRERIFEPFFTTKEKGKGTGLGLSTVFGIVSQSGGHIDVESKVGRGTTFGVYLPRSERVIERPFAQAEIAPRTGSETILVVEDDDDVRELTRTVLSRSGYRVLEAQNAGEALLVSEQHEGAIDLLLTDVVMPRIGGRTLAERLVKARPGLKVVFMSGYADDPVKLQGVLEGGAAFIPKPVVPAVLQRMIREVLDP
jgi:two-component system cell cycle sensor histidine kinase/response regulator CckA